jgi:hypothetical protein
MHKICFVILPASVSSRTLATAVEFTALFEVISSHIRRSDLLSVILIGLLSLHVKYYVHVMNIVMLTSITFSS